MGIKSGIYKITNQDNHKVYIGQSSNIEIRWAQHRLRPPIKMRDDYALNPRAFTFEILILESNQEKLDDLEEKYIMQYDSYHKGYNATPNGKAIHGSSLKGENHPSSKVTEDDVRYIRELYKQGYSRQEAYNIVAPYIDLTIHGFDHIWLGKTWTNVSMHVYELDINRKINVISGEQHVLSKLTIEEVIQIRKDYNNHVLKTDSYKVVADKISYESFNSVWSGASWSHVMPEVFTEENKRFYKLDRTNQSGSKHYNANFSDDEIMILRKRYVNESIRDIHKDYKEIISFSGMEKILQGKTYTNLPYYQKKKKRWSQ